jgi:hypothetical protein
LHQTLYVHRPLVKTDEITNWASGQGFKSILDPEDLHVTLAFSRKPLDWNQVSPISDPIIIEGGNRSVGKLGQTGAMVLHFEHPDISNRWQEFCQAGASWDYPHFKPHITISYAGHELAPELIEPFMGSLIFGPEEFSQLQEDWDQTITEIPIVGENRGFSSSKILNRIKYRESITEKTRMTELSSLLMKNIDLIMEAYNVDEKGNLIVANKKKVAEADQVFHKYFVKSMNQMFRQLDEADPMMGDPNGMGMPHHGHDDLGMSGEMLGDMSAMHGHHGMDGMDDMDGEDDLSQFGEPDGHHPMDQMHGMTMHGHGMGDDMMDDMHGMSDMQAMGESTDWLDENLNLDVNSLFDLTEDEELEEEQLDEFMGGHEEDDDMDQMGGSMDQSGGANDFGGDMGGMTHGDDGMGMGDDMGGGMDGDDDMVTIHGTTDHGGEFEFSFDPDDLGFGGDQGDDHGDDMSGGHEEPHHMSGMDHADHGMDDEEPVAESKKGLPKGRKSKSSRMGVVPASPASAHAAPFPTPQGVKQRRK